ncbi:MAG: transketolase family protein [Bacillota bacterium]|nr:transketolase family protein [Bacillota bacterium]
MAEVKMKATREAYGEALVELGEKNENIIVLDADLSKSTKTDSFKKKFPSRHINMGIAEANMMSTAAGIASCGKTVFASTFAVFAAGRAFEQIRNSICYTKLNVKIGATHAGISVGEDGGSHQAIEDIAIMRALPNMVIISPCDAEESKKAVEAAAKYDGPVYLRFGRLAVPAVYGEGECNFEIGKGIKIKDGGDVTIIATGLMVSKCLDAANELEKQGISARVIDIHTIKPIDKDIIIKAARETGKIVTVEEHSIIGGLGGAVAEVLAENAPTAMMRIGIEDKFGKSGTPAALLEEYGLTAENVVRKVAEFVK